jgi:hypothetical protein
MPRIKITANIPTYDGRDYAYLGVVNIAADFPLSAQLSDRTASLRLAVKPYRIVADGTSEIYLHHPDISRTITIANMAIESLPQGVGILPLAAQLIAANIAEWSTAEVVDG